MTLWYGSPWPFLILTIMLGGGAAWMTGRATARTWRPIKTLFVYSVLLSFAVRFLHYALGDSPLFQPGFWLRDLVYVVAVALIAFRFTRTRQMSRQYYWLYEKTSPFTWRERA